MRFSASICAFMLTLVCSVAYIVGASAELYAQRRSSFGGSRSSSSSFSRPSSSSSSSFGGSRSSSFGGSRSSGTSSSSYSSRSSSSSPYSSSYSPSYSAPRSSGSASGSGYSSRPSYSAPRSSGSGFGSSSGRSSASSAKSYGIPRKQTIAGQEFEYRNTSNDVYFDRNSRYVSSLRGSYSAPYSYSSVYNTRNSYYSGIGFTPPVYMNYVSPNYGLFNTLFLISSLNALHQQQNAAFFYNHWNNPGVVAWRNDMARVAQSDPEAAAKLHYLESRVAQLEREKNGQRDSLYMPEGIDKSVVLSDEALGAQEEVSETASQGTSTQGSSSGSALIGLLFLMMILGVPILGIVWLVRRARRRAAQNNNIGSFN